MQPQPFLAASKRHADTRDRQWVARPIPWALDATAWEPHGTFTATATQDDDSVILTRDDTADAENRGEIALDMSCDLTGRFIAVKAQALDANLAQFWWQGFATNRTSIRWQDGSTNAQFLAELQSRPRLLSMVPERLNHSRDPAEKADFRRLGIRLHAATGTTTQVRILGVWVVDMPPACMTIYLDDAFTSHHTIALPALTERGMRAAVAVETNKISGTTGYATIAQIDDMYAAGWDVNDHLKGGQLASGSGMYAGAVADMRESQQILYTNGWTRGYRHLVYPGGSRNDAVEDEVRKLYHSARGVVSWSAHGAPAVRPYAIDGGSSFYQGQNIAGVKARIDAVASHGGHFPLTFHGIAESGATGFETNRAEFEELLDHIASLGIPTVLPSEMFGESAPRPLADLV